METISISIDTILEAPFNYNLHPANQIEVLQKSLVEFGQFKNIVLWQGYCIAGNGVLLAAKQLGWQSIQAVIRDDLTEESAKRLCVADNAAPYLAIMDQGKLSELLQSIPSHESIPGYNDEWLHSVSHDTDVFPESHSTIDGGIYTKKIDTPIYEPKNEKPPIYELFNADKTNILIEKIKNANISKEEKSFLIEAARRHTVFNYQKIADYYAHSGEIIQELMEESALIIIDFHAAIEHGYVQISEEITEQFLSEHDDIIRSS